MMNLTSGALQEEPSFYLWTVAFSIILVISILGNSLVLWTVLAHRRMWSLTNYFLVNLAIADLGMAILNCIPSFISMRDNEWIFGAFYCRLNSFTSCFTVSVSVFTLLAMTLERHGAIMTPLAPRKSHKSLWVAVALIWLGGSVVALPSGLYSTLYIRQRLAGTELHACILVWPDGLPGQSTLDYSYNIGIFVVTYLLPLASMAICYIRMGRKLWHHVTPGEQTESVSRCQKEKQKVVKMFAFVIFTFGICWLPYHVYFIYSYHNPQIMKSPHIRNIYLAFYWLAMSNCAVNPIIYYWMSHRFREHFNRLLICRKSYEHVFMTSMVDTFPATSPALSLTSRRSCSVYIRSRTASQAGVSPLGRRSVGSLRQSARPRGMSRSDWVKMRQQSCDPQITQL